MASPNFVAGGTIEPSRFVTISAANTVIQSVAGDIPTGISGENSELTPLSGASTYHAASGYACKVYGPGDQCSLMLGSGGCSAGDFLKPDASGKGIVSSATATDAVGAQALSAGSAGEYIRVKVQIHRGA